MFPPVRNIVEVLNFTSLGVPALPGYQLAAVWARGLTRPAAPQAQPESRRELAARQSRLLPPGPSAAGPGRAEAGGGMQPPSIPQRGATAAPPGRGLREHLSL